MLPRRKILVSIRRFVGRKLVGFRGVQDAVKVRSTSIRFGWNTPKPRHSGLDPESNNYYLNFCLLKKQSVFAVFCAMAI